MAAAPTHDPELLEHQPRVALHCVKDLPRLEADRFQHRQRYMRLRVELRQPYDHASCVVAVMRSEQACECRHEHEAPCAVHSIDEALAVAADRSARGDDLQIVTQPWQHASKTAAG